MHAAFYALTVSVGFGFGHNTFSGAKLTIFSL